MACNNTFFSHPSLDYVKICFSRFVTANFREKLNMKKIALFVDVQNIFYTVKDKYGCYFNYRRLLTELKNEGEIVTAKAYACLLYTSDAADE